jgi:hypothetical protein
MSEEIYSKTNISSENRFLIGFVDGLMKKKCFGEYDFKKGECVDCYWRARCKPYADLGLPDTYYDPEKYKDEYD